MRELGVVGDSCVPGQISRNIPHDPSRRCRRQMSLTETSNQPSSRRALWSQVADGARRGPSQPHGNGDGDRIDPPAHSGRAEKMPPPREEVP